MGIFKIIHDNPQVFNTIKGKDYTEEEALILISSTESKGSELQKKMFNLRYKYNSVCTLIDLGYRETAINLAKTLLKELEYHQKYQMAQDICNRIIMHEVTFGSYSDALIYRELYDKFTLILQCEFDARMYYGQALHQYRTGQDIDVPGLMRQMDDIRDKQPFESLWCHYFYYQCSTLKYEGEDLEELYIEAIEYFDNVYVNHSQMKSIFVKYLVEHYLEFDQVIKAESVFKKYFNYESGSIPWFRGEFIRAQFYYKISNSDSGIKLCQDIMNLEKYSELPEDKRTQWSSLLEKLKEMSRDPLNKDHRTH